MSYKKNNYQIDLIWDVDKLPINYPSKIRSIYEKEYIKNRANYTNWIDKIGRKHFKDVDWWMTLPSFRNPYASKLLNYLTVLDTISKLKYRGIIIKTESSSFSSIINSNDGNIEALIKNLTEFSKK